MQEERNTKSFTFKLEPELFDSFQCLCNYYNQTMSGRLRKLMSAAINDPEYQKYGKRLFNGMARRIASRHEAIQMINTANANQ